jgi:hypothetical protein
MLEAPIKATHFCYSGPGADDSSLLSKYGQYGRQPWPSGCAFQLPCLPANGLAYMMSVIQVLMMVPRQPLEEYSACGKSRPASCAMCGMQRGTHRGVRC